VLVHLQARLADVLGSRLPPPFGGRVFVPPGPAAGPEPTLLVEITRAELVSPDLGSTRFEAVPGAEEPRRVVRLRCTIEFTARAGTGEGWLQQLAALDAVLYELDGPELRNGSALRAPGDPGFLLDGLEPVSVETEGKDDDRAALVAHAVGWFWPPGTPGETGEPITSALVRTALMPVALEPWPLRLRAGGPAMPLVVRVGAARTLDVGRSTVPAAPVGALALRALDAGGRPGLGVLGGGIAGPGGARIVDVVGDAVSFSYTPPADPVREQLVVAVAQADTGDGVAIGMELARFPLEVRP
jgi:hypothetical protein